MPYEVNFLLKEWGPEKNKWVPQSFRTDAKTVEAAKQVARKRTYGFTIKNLKVTKVKATPWKLDEERGGYYIWTRLLPDGSRLFNVTKTNQPPKQPDTGYYSKQSLMKLKGIK